MVQRAGGRIFVLISALLACSPQDRKLWRMGQFILRLADPSACGVQQPEVNPWRCLLKRFARLSGVAAARMTHCMAGVQTAFGVLVGREQGKWVQTGGCALGCSARASIFHPVLRAALCRLRSAGWALRAGLCGLRSGGLRSMGCALAAPLMALEPGLLGRRPRGAGLQAPMPPRVPPFVPQGRSDGCRDQRSQKDVAHASAPGSS